jgi:hypothetical protein
MNPKDKNTYQGRSAHLAVMSELAARGYKITVPEVDVGRDVLARSTPFCRRRRA